jgi:hypothetical protein
MWKLSNELIECSVLFDRREESKTAALYASFLKKRANDKVIFVMCGLSSAICGL